ncbi:DUF4331 domain-containing protein [Actinomadura livida]|uniref:DUF4331 domain-containing protein n=1 Tax=Actinomadura livida TaxID=79909 RepID=A0A7W7IBL8_9ACTN|nr:MULTISPECIES: DUF4331 domain-containing protein [Actinomadura]MBB4774099.1 hypothetical protein [Actinomadura catellatispora]GGT84897.1 hypothetical protein GCM10010208_04590 [Actinomadura livida]
MPTLHPSRTRIAALVAAGGVLLAGGFAGLAPERGAASSHREAPLVSGQPQYDNTDVYAFVSPDRPDTTTLIANFIPLQEPAGGPTFYKFARDAAYDLNIDNNGDSLADLTYRFEFHDRLKNDKTFLYNTGPVTSLDDPDLNFTQTYDLTLIRRVDGNVHGTRKIAQGAPVAPSNVGRASMPDYAKLRAQAVRPLGDGTAAFAGQADDSFFLDLRVFDLLYGANLKEVGNDTLSGYNVNTVAVQVPTRQLVRNGDPVIGVNSTVQRRNAAGGHTQVSRLGSPLVNEVVVPRGKKDTFNASSPWHDAQFAGFVTDPELPKLIEQIYKIPAPPGPRDDLVQAYLTGVPGLNKPRNVRPAELLRLNTSIKPVANPDRLGVLGGDKAGFPNGRRLTDDVVDISLQAVEGELLGKKNDLGDAVNANDREFGSTFPYVAQPHSGSDVRGARSGAAKAGAKGKDGETVNLLNAGAVEDAAGDEGSGVPGLVPIAAGSGVVAFLATCGLLWWRRRPGRLGG